MLVPAAGSRRQAPKNRYPTFQQVTRQEGRIAPKQLAHMTLRVGRGAIPLGTASDEMCVFDDFPGAAARNGLGLQAAVKPAFGDRVDFV